MHLIEETAEEITVLEPHGRIDSATAPEFGERLIALLKSGRTAGIRLTVPACLAMVDAATTPALSVTMCQIDMTCLRSRAQRSIAGDFASDLVTGGRTGGRTDVLRCGIQSGNQAWIDLLWGQGWLRLGRGE